MKTDRKLIALDLDGTTLTNDKRLTDRTRRAIVSAMEEKNELVIVTGRPYHGLPDSIMEIEDIRYFINSNGAVCHDRKEGRDLNATYLDPETAAGIYQIIREENVLYTVIASGYGFTDRETYQRLLKRYEGTPLYTYVKKSRRPFRDSAEIFGPDSDHACRVENIWYKTESREVRDRILDKIQSFYGDKINCILNCDTDAEIVNRETDKGRELLQLAERLGIERDHILAIGDNDNDAGMLKAAGFAVAMGNSVPYILDLADHVTETNENEGVALFIEQLLRSEKERS